MRPPAGPLRPALVITGLLLVAANLRAGITTVGPVLDQVRADSQMSSALASGLISLPLLAFAVVSPLVPALARRLELERTLALGLATLAVGLLVRSLPPLPLLWIGTALMGVAIAVLNVALPSLVKRDFPLSIGPVTGTYSAVQSVFAAIAAGVAVPLADATVAGWRLPLGLWAALALIGLGVLAPQLRRRTVLPESADPLRLEDPLRPAAPGAARSPWRSPLGWQVTVFMGLQSVGYYVFITWLPSIEADAGTSPATAGVHLLLLNAAGIGGSVLCSALIPRLPDQRPLVAGASTVFIVAALGLMTAPGLGAVWAIAAGLGGGACIVLALSFFGLRTSTHRQTASLSGMAQCVGYLLAACGPIAAGALHDATGSWTPTLAVLAGVFVVMAVMGMLAGRPRVIA